MSNDITLKEGNLHVVEMTIPSTFDMAGKIVVMEVRRDSATAKKLRFDSRNSNNLLTVDGQKITVVIPAFLSLGMQGSYKWQLIVFTNESDAVSSEIFNFFIKPSVVKQDA